MDKIEFARYGTKFTVNSFSIYQLINYKQNGIMIRKLKSGEYRIYSRKINPKTKKRRNLGTFESLDAAKKHEKAIQYFKHR